VSHRIVSWFSRGAASAVATKLAIARFGLENMSIVCCATGAEHPDNERFERDCEAWFGARIETIKSDEYADTWAVWEERRYLAGIAGAPCTSALKVAPRLAFQRPYDTHIFGYTADKTDIARADRLRINYPELIIETPLISAHLKKDACISMLERAGIAPPVMYALGFQNNNCIPCVKATSPAYWALVRKQFPAEFARMVELSHRLGVRLARLGGQRVFIDEIPDDHPTLGAISPSCDFLCHLAEQEFEDTP
jgi:hypothetical protein